MWHAMGWVMFYGVIAMLVYSVARERRFFAGRDPNARHADEQPPGSAGSDSHVSHSYAAPTKQPD